MKKFKKEEIYNILKSKRGYLKTSYTTLACKFNTDTDVIKDVIYMIKNDNNIVNSISKVKPFKRLFFDIETSPNVGYFWSSGYNISVTPENIIEERKIICICYKWENENKVYSLDWGILRDDYVMMEEFLKVLEEADEVVGHNSDTFDIKWFRTRCLFHGFTSMSHVKSVDTLKIARNKFKFNSNKLDYISKFLGFEGKTSAPYDLWKKLMRNNDKESLKKMISYCKNDVKILEQVYKKLSNYTDTKTNIAIFEENEDSCSCPKCGSNNYKILDKKFVTGKGTTEVQINCIDCNHYYKVNKNKIKML